VAIDYTSPAGVAYFHGPNANFNAARQFCRQNGGHLPRPRTIEEFLWLWNRQPLTASNHRFWLDAMSIDDGRSAFLFEDGTRFSLPNASLTWAWTYREGRECSALVGLSRANTPRENIAAAQCIFTTRVICQRGRSRDAGRMDHLQEMLRNITRAWVRDTGRLEALIGDVARNLSATLQVHAEQIRELRSERRQTPRVLED
jgi:lectin-like protein